MCDMTAADHSTVIAPAGELRHLLERWEAFRTVERYELYTQRQLLTLEDLGHHWRDDAPAVLRVRHPWAPGHLVASELQIELSEAGHRVMVEPGHPLTVSGTHGDEEGASAPWEIDLRNDRLDLARKQLAKQPLLPRSSASRDAIGERRRIAILDTGRSSDSIMLDMVAPQPVVARAADVDGHGTAIAALIEALRPDAEIHPVRVLVKNPGDSTHMLLGLIAALWPDESGLPRYDVVNVSLSRRITGACATVLGSTMGYVRALCARKGITPPVVAAAGNAPDQQFGYPAAFPDAVVAIAVDWDESEASYNVVVPREATKFEAYGGTETDPFGESVGPDGTSRLLYGTSFAAALVSCCYL